MNSSLKSNLKQNWLFLAFIFFFCVKHYFLFFNGGTIVLGGEGNYWQDFTILLKNQGHTWLNIGTGELTTSINSIFVFPILFSFIKNVPLTSYLITVSIYLLPFTGMYLLLTYLNKNKHFHAALLSFFYIANPFSIMYLVAINPWNMNIMATYPLFLYIFVRWYDKFPPLFFVLGIVSSILAYTLTNPPQMALFIVVLPFLMLIASTIRNNTFKSYAYLKNLLVAGTSFIFFNLWWIIHWVSVLPAAQKIYTLKFAKAWLKNQAEVSPMILKDIFSFSWIVPRTVGYSRLADYLNHPVILVLMYIPFILIFTWVIGDMKSSPRRKIIAVIFFGMFILGLFLKGINPPFANLISACFDYVKYCYIFKTAPEKFGVVFTFLTTIVLFYLFSDSKKIWFRYVGYLYLLLLFIPFLGGFYLPDIKIDTLDYATRKYTDYSEFQQFRKIMNEKYLDFRLLSLPNSGNYQVKMHLHDDKFYTGHNPIVMNIPQSFIADNSSDDYIPLFSKIDSPVESKMLGLFSIRYIVFNNRIRGWFGNFTNKSNKELLTLLDNQYKKVLVDGAIILYENPNYIPHFWIPDTIISSNETLTIEDISNKLEKMNTLQQVAFLSEYAATDLKKPMVEFKPINATKYRVYIHGFVTEFPLIFNETFNSGWKLYIKKITPGSDVIHNEKYKILAGNESDQASPNEIINFLESGLISTTENTNYISKNISGTIQNNNLPDGDLFESDNSREVIVTPENLHIKANSYANAWIIKPELCSNSFCKKNKNGSYDMELIVEYSQQKVFYKSIIITITLVILSTILFNILIIKNNNKHHKHE